MACLKSLTSNTNQPYRKVHSFSEDVSTAQIRPQMHCNCSSGNSFISPFISYQSKLDTVPLLPFLKPAKSNRDLFGCESCYINMDSRLHNLKNSVNVVCTNMPVAADTNFILSAFAALAINEMPVCVQQSLLDKTTASKQMNPPVFENISNMASATTNIAHNIAFLKETSKDSSTETPVAISSTGDSNITCCSDSNITVESIQSVEMPSADCDCSSDLSVDKCYLHKSNCSSSKTQNCKKVMHSKPAHGDSIGQSPLKPIVNLTSVLSAPRKTVKKGRPSSRKQKKRQREKQKRGLQPLQTETTLVSPHTGCDMEQELHSPNTELLNRGSKMDVASNSSSNPQHEAANGVSKPKCTLTNVFARLMSCSEDENSVDDDDDQCTTDLYINKHKEMPSKPIKGFDFGCALDLDTIFKKTNPQGPVNAEKKQDGFQKNMCQSSSRHDHFEQSSAVLKDVDSCFFTPALSLDMLFCKKPAAASPAATDQHESAADVPDGFPSDDSIDCLPSGSEADSETLEKINALWNENYPTAGYRSCFSVSADEIKHPATKVHFAAEPDLLTVHIVGTEDRNGNWHHVIREREHFERRIQELEHILSPFLETSHRAKVLEQRNGDQEQQ